MSVTNGDFAQQFHQLGSSVLDHWTAAFESRRIAGHSVKLGQSSRNTIDEGSEAAVGFSIGSVVQVAVQMGLLGIASRANSSSLGKPRFAFDRRRRRAGRGNGEPTGRAA